MAEGPLLVEIKWHANPFRGDRFEEVWTPIAEAALDYGATHWGLYRAQDGLLDFTQHAVFPDKLDWERYWYSERVAEARTELTGMFQIPVLPTYWTVTGAGTREPAGTAEAKPA